MRRPQLQEIYGEFGSLSLGSYVKTAWEVSKSAPDPLFLEVLKNALAPIYPDGAEVICRQIANQPVVSTIDHLGIWNHPIFVNSDLIYSLYFSKEQFLPVFATESISLNNTSSWSGCLQWHDESRGLLRRSFFPDRLKTLPVFSAPALQKKDLEDFKNKLPQDMSEVLGALGAEDALKFSTFSHQAAHLSSQFWKAVFPSAPKLAVVGLESLMAEYLLQISCDKTHYISQLVFTPEGRSLWRKYFPDDKTSMFWGINGHGRREALKSFPEAKELGAALRKKTLYPSSPLCFVLLMNAGLTCVGGFTQTTWLTAVKKQLLSLFSERGWNEERLRISELSARNFAEGSLSVLKKNENFFEPSAVDLFLSGRDMYPTYLSLAESITLKESIDLSIPTIYRVVVPLEKRGPEVGNYSFHCLQARQKANAALAQQKQK